MTVGVRSFIAVTLPAPVQQSVLGAATSLAAALPGVRWSRKVENLHVTLKFLGDVDSERLDALGAALAQRLAASSEFPISVRGFGAFPSLRAASIVWAGIEDRQQRLAAVAADVQDVAAGFGFAAEERPFRGHVTVGRTRERDSVDARAALAPFVDHLFGDVTVGEVSVYESRLGRGGEGSTYILRCRAPLGGSATTPHKVEARPQ